MLARVRSAAVFGIDAYLVDVETDIANGLPTFATVGLPQGAVKEGRERVYAALANSGYTFPLKRITGIEISRGSCQSSARRAHLRAGAGGRRPLRTFHHETLPHCNVAAYWNATQML